MITRNRIIAFVVVAIVHLIVTFVFFLSAVGSALEGLDTAEPYSASERIVSVIAEVLIFPLVTLASELPSFLGPLTDLSFILNSMLWSAAICFGIPLVLRRITGRSSST